MDAVITSNEAEKKVNREANAGEAIEAIEAKGADSGSGDRKRRPD
jgi:hypothetical protein